MRAARTTRVGSVWDAIQMQAERSDEQSRKSEYEFKQAMDKIDRNYEFGLVERREMEARVERDRAATEARLAADRKEAAEKL